MRIQTQYEKPHRKRLNKIFDQQHKETIEALTAHASSFNAKTKDFNLFDDSSYDQQMSASLTPVLTDLARVQGGLAMTFAGAAEDNEFLITAPMKEALAAGTKKMAQNVNDRTLEKLNNTLAQGISEGEGLGKLKARVDGVFSDLKGYESARIARTETLKASNFATEWAYQQTGYVVGKQWVVNPDACEMCQEMDGKTIEVGTSFLGLGDTLEFGDGGSYAIDYDSVDNPPLHPNCRCTVIPTTTLGENPSILSDESGFIGGDDEDKAGATVFRGTGNNVGANGGLMFGDAFYVARSASQAANFGTVHQLSLPITRKDILIIRTDAELEEFQLAAEKWAVRHADELADLSFNTYLPAYIRAQGYKAAEVLPSVDPLGGIGVVDKKAIAALAAQMETKV